MGKHVTHIIFALAIIMSIVACDRGNRVSELADERLCHAFEDKDSALALMAAIDSSAAMNDEEEARYAMLRIAADYYADRKPDGDSAALATANYFKGRGGLAESLAQIAAATAYESLGETAKVLPYYVAAAQQLEGSGRYGLLSLVYGRWGWLLKTEPPYTDALAKLNEAEKYARKAGDYVRLTHIIGMQGWAYLFKGDLQQTVEKFEQSEKMSREHGNVRLGWVLKSQASAYELLGLHHKALACAEAAMAATPSPDRALIGIKGMCFVGTGQFDSARVYIEKGRLDGHHYDRATYHYELARLAEAQGNYKEALRQRTLYENYVDSTYDEDRRLALAQAEKRYNYAVVEAERDHYAMENQRKMALIVALVAALVAVGTVAVYVHQRFRRRIAAALRMKEDLYAQSLAQVKERSLQLMRIKQEAQDKEMELLTSLTRKEEQLAELRQQQRELKESILHTNDVIQKIEALKEMNEKKKIKSATAIALSNEEIQNLLESTNVCYDNFVDRLRQRFDDLSQDDICLCCLLKLGISSQDQCLLLNTTDSTLRTRKYRLKKKKMQLADDFETLDDFVRVF